MENEIESAILRISPSLKETSLLEELVRELTKVCKGRMIKVYKNNNEPKPHSEGYDPLDY